MKIGLIGVGRIGVIHATTLASLPAVESLIIIDSDTQRAKEVSAELGAQWAPDVEALLGEGVDGVVIAAPTDTHAGLMRATVGAGVTTFCEKPLASEISGAVEVVEYVSRSKVKVQIGFQRRFDPGFVAARQQVLENRLGWLHTIRGGTLDPAPPPEAYVASSGGIFRDCSIHDIDAVRWVSGQEVRQVYAVGSNRGATFFADFDDVDTAAAILTLEDGCLAVISATRYNGAGYDVRLELMGSQASVSAGLDEHLPLRSTELGIKWPSGPAYSTFLDRFRLAYIAEMEAFVEMVDGRRDSPCSPADALETFYVAEACERSRREAHPVDVGEIRR